MEIKVSSFNRRILNPGYNGVPKLAPNHQLGWLLRQLDHVPAVRVRAD